MSKRNGSFKGCCRMCALRLRGQGDAKAMHRSELADFGRDRRVKRGGIPEDQLDLEDYERAVDGAVRRYLRGL